MMGYIDSHAHLCDERLLNNISQEMIKFKDNNIDKILVICCSSDDYLQGLALHKTYKMIDLAVGIHPEDASNYGEHDVELLERQLADRQVVAIGEIGLDYYWVKDNKGLQIELFKRQLQMANTYDLPVIIHCRDASEDVYNILKAVEVKRKGLMHCYSGSVEMMRRFVGLGYSISLAGPITFKNARHSVDVAMDIPIEYLLYETDSPYLTPEPNRGKLNSPNNVIYVAQKIAQLRSISVEVLNTQVALNYQRIFGND